MSEDTDLVLKMRLYTLFRYGREIQPRFQTLKKAEMTSNV